MLTPEDLRTASDACRAVANAEARRIGQTKAAADHPLRHVEPTMRVDHEAVWALSDRLWQEAQGMTPTATKTVWELLGDYLPGGLLADAVRHLVPPDDNGDKEWSLVVDEARKAPMFAALVQTVAAGVFPEPIRADGAKLTPESTVLLCAAMDAGRINDIPVAIVDYA
jgi:hypothetical protein